MQVPDANHDQVDLAMYLSFQYRKGARSGHPVIFISEIHAKAVTRKVPARYALPRDGIWREHMMNVSRTRGFNVSKNKRKGVVGLAWPGVLTMA